MIQYNINARDSQPAELTPPVKISDLIFMISIKRKRAEKEAEQALQDVNELLEENRLVGMLSEYLQSCQQLDEAYEIIEKHVPEILPNTSGAVYRMLNSKNYHR